jgi:hypothetical protein
MAYIIYGSRFINLYLPGRVIYYSKIILLLATFRLITQDCCLSLRSVHASYKLNRSGVEVTQEALKLSFSPTQFITSSISTRPVNS